MGLKFEQHEYTLGGWWLSALHNGDYSGLTTEECAALNSWLEIHAPGRGHWSGGTSDDEGSILGFTTDEISGLKGDCFRMTWNMLVEPKRYTPAKKG